MKPIKLKYSLPNQFGLLNNTKLFSHTCEGWKIKIKRLEDLAFGKSSLPSL